MATGNRVFNVSPTPAAPAAPTPAGSYRVSLPSYNAAGNYTGGSGIVGGPRVLWQPTGPQESYAGRLPEINKSYPAIQDLFSVTNPSGGGGAAPKFTFSLMTDPAVLDALNAEQQGIGQLDAQLKRQREQQIIALGDPALAQEAGFGLDPQAGAFAKQNYLAGNATLARLDKQHQLARQAVINQLAAHGILNSGDLGYRETQADSAYGNQVYDARQSALTNLANLYNQYLQQRQSLHQQVLQAEQAAIANFLSNPDIYAGAFSRG